MGRSFSKSKPPVSHLCQWFSEILGLFGPPDDWTTTQGQAKSNRGKCLVTWFLRGVTIFWKQWPNGYTDLFRSILSELLLGGKSDRGLHQVVLNHIYNLRIGLWLSCLLHFPSKRVPLSMFYTCAITVPNSALLIAPLCNYSNWLW